MIKKNLLLTLINLIIFQIAIGQPSHIFTQALAIGNAHQYGREGLFTDQFAFRYFAPGFQTPKAGVVLFTNDKGQEIIWKEIKADTSGRFVSRDASNGYIYLTYISAKEQNVVLNISGNSMFYCNGEPHAGDIYGDKWLYTPVKFKKGLNEIYVRTPRYMYQGIKARLLFPQTPIEISTEDATLTHIVPGHRNDSLMGAVVIINSGNQPLKDLKIKSTLNGREITSTVPTILPLSTRKVAFLFDASAIREKGNNNCNLTLFSGSKSLAKSEIKLESVSSDEPYSKTFISNIDGSVQYYAVNPQSTNTSSPSALFLSVHGAGVEAIGQACAYKAKNWGNLVAPTNRRPRGFNWEDWGRIDAMEVLDLAEKVFQPDPSRIYLTGHSMGGHGTWYLGATFPGKWAAIAPCAGYPSLMGYGSADGKIPQPGVNEIEKSLYRASNGSNVFELAKNYKASGIYIHHGDSDKVVSVDYARQMRKVLGEFHQDFSYYEYPGGSHWFGDQSVDWPPLFDYFKWHTIPHDSTRNTIDFTTANPAVSSSYYWASVLQQKESLKYSRIKLNRSKNLISGETENVSILKLSTPQVGSDSLTIKLDGDVIRIKISSSHSEVYLQKNEHWMVIQKPESDAKGIIRNGTFKEPFNNRMVFVYGTTGTKQENDWSLAKARFDAEPGTTGVTEQ
ncbi:MAG: prolyl oligopeptidase family serine peptidase [Bacteroidetes bacterium]|nr:prolyl oligopeptidase family serine peptidase [Bacteroidota bacterium]